MHTIYEAAAALRQGRVTPLGLVEQCLSNIERWEPRVHAWVFIDKGYAYAEAKRLGDELRKGQDRGPLHGIPVAIKDIFDVFDWPTAAGSKLWAQSIARQDAPLVKRLRQAGAIFLGKTVTTQYASFDPPVTCNPWNPERTPGGSSSGSAAALATGMCLGALGSQTGGSITRPASYCGVAGLKPTYGLLPLDGIVPLAPSMDHPGPMARCVRDLGLMMQVLAGIAAPQGALPLGASSKLDSAPPLLGRLHGLFDDRAEPAVRTAMAEVADKLARKGATVLDVALPAGFADVLARHRVIMAVEGAVFHEERLRRHPEDYAPRIRALLEEGLACPAPEYARAKEGQQHLREDMAGCFERVSVLICPATPGPAPDRSTTGDPAFNSPWSYTGLPTVSFPTGQFVDGLPLALQIVGEEGEEERLLAVAQWCEEALEVQPLTPG